MHKLNLASTSNLLSFIAEARQRTTPRAVFDIIRVIVTQLDENDIVEAQLGYELLGCSFIERCARAAGIGRGVDDSNFGRIEVAQKRRAPTLSVWAIALGGRRVANDVDIQNSGGRFDDSRGGRHDTIRGGLCVYERGRHK